MCSIKKLFAKISQYSQKKPPVLKSLLNKVAGRKEEQLRTAASEVTLESDSLGLSFWRAIFKTILK